MENRFSTSHLGTQPIRVLQHNIASRFENTNPEFIELAKATIANQGLQNGLGYYINEFAIMDKVDGHTQTPFVNLNQKKIYIHETFMSYVWCISYSLYVLFDEEIAKQSQNRFAGKRIHEID